MEDIALLDAYLHDQLGSKDRSIVEQRLQTDAEFAALADDLAVLRQGIKWKYRQQLKAELHLFEQTLPAVDLSAEASNEPNKARPQNQPSAKSEVKWWERWLLRQSPRGTPAGAMARIWLVSTVTLVILGLGIWLLVPKKSPEEKLFAAYFEPTKMEQTRARRVKTKEQLRFEATQAFNNDRFTEAIPLLQELFESHQDTTSLYFIGLAQLGNGQTDEAIQSLTRYHGIYEDVRYPHPNYYIGLAHLRARRYDLAISFLEKDQSARSDRLIEEIRTLQLQNN